MSSVSAPQPTPGSVVLSPQWEFRTGAVPVGIDQARESGWVLAWDEKHWLYLLDRAGRPQAQLPAPLPLVAACCSDDGSAYAALGRKGEVWWLAPDLMPRWQTKLVHRGVSAALDPFGHYLAVSDTHGDLSLFDQHGKLLVRTQSPRPLHYLAFVPEAPLLVGSADLGLVIAFDLQGNCLWRDGLAANVGGFAVSGDGNRTLVACYSEGLRGYSLDGTKQTPLTLPEPSRLVAMSYDGRRTLVAGLSNRLFLIEGDGRVLVDQRAEQSLVSVLLGPLGNTAVLALADGRILGLELRER